jgi:hypothetical protein
MGIRIKKVLGYGFKHCTFKDDPRFNDWVFDCNHDLHENPVNQKLIDFYTEKQDPAKYTSEFDDAYDLQYLAGTGWHTDKGPAKELYTHDFIENCAFEYERGKGFVLFTSPINEDWYRYDDIIDYSDSENMDTKIKKLKTGIFPLNSSYIDRRTGKRVKTINPSIYSMTHQYIDEISEDFKKEFNVKSLNELCVNIVPLVPSVIVNFCNVFNVFKNPLTVYRLKPMVVTYWD